MIESEIRKNTRNIYKTLFLIITPILSGVLGVSIVGSTIMLGSLQNTNSLIDQYYSDWQTAQQNYEQANQDYLLAQQNYVQAYQDYLSVLEDYNAYQEQIEHNTGFSGHFNTVIDWSSNFGSMSHLLDVSIPYNDYFSYRLDYPHPSHSSPNPTVALNAIASYCLNSSIIYSLASSIRDSGYTVYTEDDIDAILSLCQNRGDDQPGIRYIDDGIDDFAKYPVETLAEGGGDCEDTSILFCSLMASIGKDVILIFISGHTFAGVHLTNPPAHNSQYPTRWYIDFGGTRYYMCETTGFGWRIGDLPPSSQGQSCYCKVIQF